MSANAFFRLLLITIFIMQLQPSAEADENIDLKIQKILINSDSTRDTTSYSIVNHPYTFNSHQLIVPGILIGVGIVGVYESQFQSFRHFIKDTHAKLRGDRFWHYDDYLQYTTAVGYLGFGLLGVKARSSFKERLCAGITAYMVMAAIVNPMKFIVREQRPDSEARNSFPSGHTATAFTGAELIRIEYGPYYGAFGYAIACGIGFLRMYNDRHWINDVLAGAGIGILSARIGYWLLPLYRKWFKWETKSEYIPAFSPVLDINNRTFGLSLGLTF